MNDKVKELVERVKTKLIEMDDEEEPCPPIDECPNKEQLENDDCKKCWATYIVSDQELALIDRRKKLPIDNSDIEAMFANIFAASYPTVATGEEALRRNSIAEALRKYKKRLEEAGFNYCVIPLSEALKEKETIK